MKKLFLFFLMFLLMLTVAIAQPLTKFNSFAPLIVVNGQTNNAIGEGGAYKFTVENGSYQLVQVEMQSLLDTILEPTARIQLWDDSGTGGRPGIVLANLTVNNLSDTSGTYNMTLENPFILQNGTTYWLANICETCSPAPSIQYDMRGASSTGTIFSSTQNFGASWTAPGSFGLWFTNWGISAENVTILQDTYLVLNAENNNTLWRSSINNTVQVNDTTPTVQFDVNVGATCAIATVDLNFTDMSTANNDTLCSTGFDTSHTCTLPGNDPLVVGIQNIYISCASPISVQGATSTSEGLSIELVTNVTPPPPPINVTGNFSCFIFDDKCVNGEIKCLLAVNNNNAEAVETDAFNLACESINTDNPILIGILFLVSILFIYLGFKFRSIALGLVGGLLGMILSSTFIYSTALLAMALIFLYGGITFIFLALWIGSK